MENMVNWLIDKLLETKVGQLSRGSFISISYDEVPDHDYFPLEYKVERVDKNTLEITPDDKLFDDSHFSDNMELFSIADAIYFVDRLKATISVIKKYSTTEPLFEFDIDDKYFRYSFTISGETFGEVFDTVGEIYREIEDKVGSADPEMFIAYFKNTI